MPIRQAIATGDNMRKYRIQLTAAAAVLGALALPVVAVPVAQASTSVVVYACGMAGNWRCPAVRPSEVGFGALWDVAGVRWTHWTGRSAYGAGQYWLGRGDGYRADIALTDVKNHGSQRYFEDASIIAPRHRTVHLWYGSDHGVVGWWKA
jgi:hypothetical protein